MWYASFPIAFASHRCLRFAILVFTWIWTSACGPMSSGPLSDALACSVNCRQSDDLCQLIPSKDWWCHWFWFCLDQIMENATLAGLPAYLLNQLQAVMNAGARLIFIIHRCEHITLLLRQLHWLRVPDQITFKLVTLMFQCVNWTAPGYLSFDVWRVAASSLLAIPATWRSPIGDRAFVVAAAFVWNKTSDLPHRYLF